MKIRKLQLKNIGPFDDETIEFQECPKDKAEIHILTGENGTGKTTLLMALAGAFQHSEQTQDEAITEREFLNQWGHLFKSASPKNEDEEKLLAPLNKMLKVLEKRSQKSELALLNKSKSNFDKRFRFFEYDGKEDFVYKKEDRFKSQVKIILNENEVVKIFANPTWWNSILSHTSSNSIIEYRNFLTFKGIPKQKLKFGAFAFSVYRKLQSESIEAIREPKEFNPLFQSLDFEKDYQHSTQLTINQLIANNISKTAIEKGRNEEKSKRFEKVISSIEKIITEITGLKIEFDMQTEPVNLVTKMNSKELDFDVLPDGLRSLISWIADLLGRVDLLNWEDNLPITEKNLILFLDEIEVHLHPAWQRKVLPVVQKLFKNSQIFLSTHSPFVVNSVDDAWVYKLELEDGKAKVADVVRSEDGWSYRYVLRNTFGIDKEFGVEVEQSLKDFYELRDKVLTSNGNKEKAKKDLLKKAKGLAKQTKELKTKIDFELFQLSEMTGEDFSL